MVQCIRCELSPVVDLNHFRQLASFLAYLTQDACDVFSTEARLRPKCQAFARMYIDQREDADLLSTREYIVHEIHGPALICRCSNLKRRPHSCRFPTPRALACERESFFAIKPINSLVIHHPALASQHHVEPQVAKADAIPCELVQPSSERLLGRPDTLVANHRSVYCHRSARPALRKLEAILRPSD